MQIDTIMDSSHSHNHGHHNDHDHEHEHEHHNHNNHAHDHHHHHHDENDDDSQRVLRRLKIASILCSTFFIVEVLGGWLSGSLAILSDAAHLLADLAAFCVAIAASHLGRLPSTSQHTYGLKRTESLAALFSMVSLALVSLWLALEALRRLWPIVTGGDVVVNVDGKLMSGIATIGVVVNVALAFILGEHHVHMPGADHDHSHGHACHDQEEEERFHLNNNGCEGESHDHHSHNNHDDTHDHSHEHSHENEQQDALLEDYGSFISHADELPPHTGGTNDAPPPHNKPKQRNINLHAAYLHVLGDLAQSVAVLIAGLVIWFQPEWRIVDPICTLLFCAIVFYSTLGVLRSSISVLLEEVPPHLDWDAVHCGISSVEGVVKVHDLHIWSISHGVPTLSVHASCSTTTEMTQAMVAMNQVCRSFGIKHATIQLQPDSIPDCITCCPNKSDKQCR